METMIYFFTFSEQKPSPLRPFVPESASENSTAGPGNLCLMDRIHCGFILLQI